jgi:iron complex outermembrane receptor protein
MDELRASQSFNMNNSNLTSTDPNTSYFSTEGGNPELRPYIADGVDVSLEKYFGRSAYISAAGYYKKLSNFVNSSSSHIEDFSAVRAAPQPGPAAQLGTTQGLAKGRRTARAAISAGSNCRPRSRATSSTNPCATSA